MERQLQKETGIPYYIQIKNILKKQINSGEIRSKKLDPIRKVAKNFGVSVNTVLRAYDELGREGILQGAVGKGTYIITKTHNRDLQNRKTILRKIIEHALEEALNLEFSISEFQETTEKYLNEKLDDIKNIKGIFFECNVEQLIYFTEHLDLDQNIQRVPVLIEELNNPDDETLKEIESGDIFVTSFYHLDNVREKLSYLGKPIIGINLEPEISTIIEIAKIPNDSVIGIITTSERFGNEIKDVLKELDLRFAEIYQTCSKDTEYVKKIVMKCSALLVSPTRKNEIENYVEKDTNVIEFVFIPDRTSINNLKVVILELNKALMQ